ncbi:MAG: hypothetical protein HY736_00340 [Verrucomicrobia bacterium]|nr:hypothetical protein [Verrucomicrobiota bacterium]
MKWNTRKRLQSVLGLSVADGQLRAAQVARAKSAVAVLKSTTATLSLDLFHPEIELIGHEFKNHLEAARIRERHCVVAIPARWIMSQHTKVPDLSPEDTASLLAIEAEKGFPCDPDELQIARSPHRSAESAYVTQLAIRKDQLTRLMAVTKSAGLKPVSFLPGLAALPGAVTPAGEGRMTLRLEPKGATRLSSAGGGIAAFRTLEATIDSEAGENVVNGAALARELRITFEQVPADLRREVRQLCLRGDETMARQLEEILGGWARDAGLQIERDPAPARAVAEEIVEQLGIRYLKDGAPELEFLPPRPSRWSRLLSGYSSRRLAVAGFATAAAAVVALGAFGWQEYRLWSLRSEWAAMAAQVKELDAVTARIREYRPWYDTSFRNLTIMKRVVECFPDNGSVTAKSVEIHGVANISVTGTARDNASLLRTLDQLRQAKEITGLKIEQIRGKTPAQFTFTFRWSGNPGT